MPKITHTSPNHAELWTPEQFTEKLGIPFSGPGMYLTVTHTIVVIPRRTNQPPSHSTIWLKEQTPDTIYEVHVYNAPFENTILSVIAIAPNRRDDRP